MKNIIKIIFTIIFILNSCLLSYSQGLYDFTPKTASSGQILTLTGSFSPNINQNEIYFGKLKATILTSTASEMTVEVPFGVTTCKLSLVLNNKFYENSASFRPLFNPVVNPIDSNSFKNLTTLKFNYTPTLFTQADLDSDGLMDIIVACNTDTSIYVYKNKNIVRGRLVTENFELATKLKASTSISALKTADVDADGKLDILFCNQLLNSFSVIKNVTRKGYLSHTSFNAKLDFTTGSSPRAIYIKDINYDLKQDVLVANYGSNTVSIFQNKTLLGVLNSNTYSSKFNLETGEQPVDVVAGDIQNDNSGSIEFAIANYNSNSILIYRLKSKLSNSLTEYNDTCYTIYDLLITKSNPSSIYIEDLNSDNSQEIVVVNQELASISVFPNVSRNNQLFDERKDFITNSFPSACALSDISGDGSPEIIITNATSNNLSIFQNNTIFNGPIDNTTILSKKDIIVGSQPKNILVADFDNNGKPDLASLDIISKQISFRTSNIGGLVAIDGKLNNVTLKKGENSIVQSVIVSAENISSNLVITPSGANVQISLSDDAGFTDSPISILPINDYVTNTTIYVKVLGNNSIGISTAIISCTSLNALKNEVSFGIRNGVPSIDSVFPDFGLIGDVITLTGKDLGNSKSNVSVDFGGVKAEIITINDSVITAKVPLGASNSKILVNAQGYQSYTNNVFYPTFLDGDFLNEYCFSSDIKYFTSAYPLTIVNNDFNNDNKQDLALNHGNGFGFLTNKSLNNTVENSFKNNNYITYNAFKLLNADLDGDSRSDLIANNLYSSVFSIFKNKLNSDSITLSSSFENQFDFNNFGAKAGICVVDLNLDGKLDILSANNGLKISNGNTISVYQNSTAIGTLNSNSFLKSFELNVLDNTSDVNSGDFNNDKFPEIIAVNKNGSLSIFQNIRKFNNLNANSFLPAFDLYLGEKPADLEIIDINKDGKNDIVALLTGLGKIQIYINQHSDSQIELNSNSFQTPISINIIDEPNAFAINDFDGDARPDIVLANYNSASVSLYKNIYTSGNFNSNSFQSKVNFNVGDSPFDVKVVDIDNDGKPEIITTNSGGVSLGIGLPVTGSISVLHNKVNPNATNIEVDRLELLPFNIAPNPTSDNLNIIVSNNIKIDKYILLTIKGTVIRSINDVNSNELTTSVSDLPKGIYLVKIITSKGVGIKRLEIY